MTVVARFVILSAGQASLIRSCRLSGSNQDQRDVSTLRAVSAPRGTELWPDATEWNFDPGPEYVGLAERWQVVTPPIWWGKTPNLAVANAVYPCRNPGPSGRARSRWRPESSRRGGAPPVGRQGAVAEGKDPVRAAALRDTRAALRAPAATRRRSNGQAMGSC